MTDLTETPEKGSLEKPGDAGLGGAGEVKRWIKELALAEKEERKWRKAGQRVVSLYQQEKEKAEDGEAAFNILYSNTETMVPSLYSQTPTPDVRRRFSDKDPVGKIAAEMLERGVSFALDHYDFDSAMELAVYDRQLPGRGVTRVRYEPITRSVSAPATGEAGVEPAAPDGKAPPVDPNTVGTDVPEEVVYEAVRCEHVNWMDFRRGPGRTWDEVDWIGFKHYPTKEENEEWFPGKDVPLTYTEEGEEKDTGAPDSDIFKRGEVWEIWDKSERKVKWVCEKYPDDLLRKDDDPLSLQNFWPIPRPLQGIRAPGSLVPVEPYRLYQNQADELDEITKRINSLIEVCQARGVADPTIAELWKMEDKTDGELVPAENIAQFMSAGGGLDNAVWMWPVEKIIVVLRELYVARDQIKQTIYEITGISDILRGDTQASETATAQSIKAQWGSLRLRRSQRDVQRYARDLIRIMAEIMAEKFQPQTLMLITGLQLDEPTMMAVMEVLRSDAMRSYRVDIETDSTIQPDEEADKQAITELLSGITNYLAAMGPAVQQGYIPAEAAKAILLSAVRRFRLGREVEDALEEIGQQQQQVPPEMLQQAVQQSVEGQRLQLDRDKMTSEREIKLQEIQLKFRDLLTKQQDANESRSLERDRMAQDERTQRAASDFEREQFNAQRGDTEAAQALEQDKVAAGAPGFVQAIQTMLKEQQEANTAMGEAMQAMAQAIMAPKQVIRGRDGRVSGVQTIQ